MDVLESEVLLIRNITVTGGLIYPSFLPFLSTGRWFCKERFSGRPIKRLFSVADKRAINTPPLVGFLTGRDSLSMSAESLSAVGRDLVSSLSSSRELSDTTGGGAPGILLTH